MGNRALIGLACIALAVCAAAIPIAAASASPAIVPAAEVSASASSTADSKGTTAIPWPGRVIPVVDRSRGALRKIVTEALHAWNSSGINIRFKRVKSDRRRELTITPKARYNVWRGGGGGTTGLAQLGYLRPGLYNFGTPCVINGIPPGFSFEELARRLCPGTKLRRIKKGYGWAEIPKVSAAEARELHRELLTVTVHELGHVLGLKHREKGCLAMNSTMMVNCRAPDPTDLYGMCQVPMPADVRAAVKIYGGKVKVKAPAKDVCAKFPEPGAPRLKVSQVADEMPLDITLGYLPPPRPKSLRGGSSLSYGGRLEVFAYGPGECALVSGTRDPLPEQAQFLGEASLSRSAKSGQTVRVVVEHPGPSWAIDEGSYCLAAQVKDRFGRSSPLSAVQVVESLGLPMTEEDYFSLRGSP